MRRNPLTLLFAVEVFLLIAGKAAAPPLSSAAGAVGLACGVALGALCARDLARRGIQNAVLYGLLACLVPVIGFFVYVTMRARHPETTATGPSHK